jgi:hypothetical protein
MSWRKAVLSLVGVGALLGASVTAAQEQRQIVFGPSGVCDGQIHVAEIYENHGPGSVSVVKSRMAISGDGGGGYVYRGDGFVLAFTGFEGRSWDKEVTAPGTTITVPPEGYLYVTYWCFGGGPSQLWVLVEYVPVP